MKQLLPAVAIELAGFIDDRDNAPLPPWGGNGWMKESTVDLPFIRQIPTCILQLMEADPSTDETIRAATVAELAIRTKGATS